MLLCDSIALGAELPRISGLLEGYGVVRLDHSVRQRPLARLELTVEQKISARTRLRVTGIGLWGGTIENSDGAGLIDFGHAFQKPDPSLQLGQAYLDHSTESLDIRVGTQIFTWGRLDGTRPNDRLNPRIYLAPLVTDDLDAKIAVPALSVGYAPRGELSSYLPEESRLMLVWIPIAVPWRFPFLDERWFPPVARVPSPISVPALSGTPCPCELTVDQGVDNEPAPARRFENSSFAFRYSSRTAEVDWALVYYDGFDAAPSFDLNLQVDPNAQDLDPEVFEGSLRTQLLPAYVRYRSIGADLETTFGPATLRAEGAWRFRRAYPLDLRFLQEEIQADEQARRRLANFEPVRVPAFVRRDALEWGIGADYLRPGSFSLLEFYQIVVVDNDARLVIRDVDSRIAASLQKRFLDERLLVQVIGLWGIESGYELVRTELTYAFSDTISARVGVLGISGDRNSLIGEFDRNGELYAMLRCAF